MKPIIIKQPIGLGDIFFCQKIAFDFLSKGHQVIWPVYPNVLKNIIGYLNNGINYIDLDSNFNNKNEYFQTDKCSIKEHEECIIVSTDGCKIKDLGVMQSKYALLKMDFSDWLDFFKFKRNKEKEKELFYDLLCLKDNDDFIFVNNKIGSTGHESYWNIPYPKNIKHIELNIYNNFSIFDWSLVIERAKEFHVMETSITYLIEALNTRASTYNMYARNETNSHDFIDYTKMYKNKSWNFIGSEKIK